jgi:hypothetical protein
MCFYHQHPSVPSLRHCFNFLFHFSFLLSHSFPILSHLISSSQSQIHREHNHTYIFSIENYISTKHKSHIYSQSMSSQSHIHTSSQSQIHNHIIIITKNNKIESIKKNHKNLQSLVPPSRRAAMPSSATRQAAPTPGHCAFLRTGAGRAAITPGQAVPTHHRRAFRPDSTPPYVFI